MRILFNATAALHGTSGFAHTLGLVGEMTAARPRHSFVVLTSTVQHALRERLPPGVTHLVLQERGRGGLARTIQLQLQIGRIARKAGADIIYNKGNFYAPAAGRQVCFIENSNPFSVVDFGEPLAYRMRNRLLGIMSRLAVRRATAVVFPSDHMRRLVAQRADVRARACVIPYGFELPTSGVECTPPDRPFVLCVSSVLPYKNLPLALDAFADLRRSGRFDGDLFIVGVSGVAGGGYYRRLIDARVGDLGLPDHVRLVPPLDPEALAALYKSAACVVMPSLEESFGMPLIEAMGLGVPVAAARVTGVDADRYFVPFEEICREAAEYFDPFDAASCADAIERTFPPTRRAALIAAGRTRAARYSWRAAADATLALFDSLA